MITIRVWQLDYLIHFACAWKLGDYYAPFSPTMNATLIL